MTSLIFGAIYMGHQGVVAHRREKQRTKNYERWEGLRDEYDEQRRISRESRSLDLQRTGSTNYGQDHDRPILTLRDQQEANDARTSWRPQESFDGHTSHRDRHASVPASQTAATYYQPPPSYQSTAPQQVPQSTNIPRPALVPQGTGATWDDGLPQPLQVSRRSFDDYDYGRFANGRVSRTVSTPAGLPTNGSRDGSRSGSISGSGSNSRDQSNGPSTHRPTSTLKESATMASIVPIHNTQPTYHAPNNNFTKVPEFDINPVEHAVPGGRMAELIERGF